MVKDQPGRQSRRGDVADRMAQVLAEMSVLSEVPAARHGDVVHGGERNQAPRGPRRTLAEEHGRAWRLARSTDHREAILEAAELALIEARKSRSPRAGLVPETLEWRVAIAREPGSVEQVAYVFGVARATVYRLREQFSCDRAAG